MFSCYRKNCLSISVRGIKWGEMWPHYLINTNSEMPSIRYIWIQLQLVAYSKGIVSYMLC